MSNREKRLENTLAKLTRQFRAFTNEFPYAATELDEQALCEADEALADDAAGGGEPERMAITIQRAPRCLWHSDCDAGEIKGSGIMKEVERDDEEGVTLLECLHCGRKGYVPHGTEFDMPVCVDVVGGSSADDDAPPQHREALEALERINQDVKPRHEDYQFLRRHLTAPPTVPEVVMKEAIYLLHAHALPSKCPRWEYGIGDCERDDCDFCRIQRCIDELDRVLAQHSEPGREECGWSLDDEGYYQTDCGTEFETVDFLRLEEMPSMKHCANCGRRIRDDSPAPDADEREDG